MDEQLQKIFFSELEKQCAYAKGAIKQLEITINTQNNLIDAHPQEDFFSRMSELHADAFRQLHSFLTHTSNISKILWPSKPQPQKHETNAAYKKRILQRPKISRSSALRKKLGYEETHTLSDRTLRDHLEHYDERLDEWGASSENKNIVTDMIGDPASVAGIDARDRMRTFNPGNYIYTFRGDEYSITQLYEAVEELAGKLSNKP